MRISLIICCTLALAACGSGGPKEKHQEPTLGGAAETPPPKAIGKRIYCDPSSGTQMEGTLYANQNGGTIVSGVHSLEKYCDPKKFQNKDTLDGDKQ